MGLDLALLPFDCDTPSLAFSHTILQCERRRELWPLVEDLPSEKVPRGFTCYLALLPNGEAGYGVR